MYSIYLLNELIMTVAFADSYRDSVTCSLLLLLCRLMNLQVLQQHSVLLLHHLYVHLVLGMNDVYCNAFQHLCHTERLKNESFKLNFKIYSRKTQGKTHAVPSDNKHSITYCILYQPVQSTPSPRLLLLSKSNF